MIFLFDHSVVLFLAIFILLALVAQLGFRIRQAYVVTMQEALHEQASDQARNVHRDARVEIATAGALLQASRGRVAPFWEGPWSWI
ncbi:MAG: hypothetical protein ACJ74Z_21995 [Bryobacteraceae bacterium]